MANRFELLNKGCLLEAAPVPATASWTLTDSREETVIVLTALLPSGMWCYGVQVYWKNGYQSVQQPTPARGTFFNPRHAQLYALGFLEQFAGHFTPDSVRAIADAIAECSQGSLFE